jgi:hypothetical protein
MGRLADLFVDARPRNLGVARFAEDLDLAFLPFVEALALPRLAGLFIIPSGMMLHWRILVPN